MCGIAGIVGAGDVGTIQAMTRALAHRGPDGEGFHVDAAQGVYLGHRRLSIIDVAGGAQPMWSDDGQVCVVFNGEIYNHQALRAELIAAGHAFLTSHSDTEVLVHGYEEWGVELAQRLNGMFAFAILDRRRRRLYLARDRFGEKPLYYARSREAFAFASELAALAQHPGISTELSPIGLRKLFGYGYIPAPYSLYEGVAKLPAGHWMTVDLADRTIARTRYWRFELAPDDAMSRRSEDDLAEELRHLLTESVRLRMVSDVPLGIFLSGGIDSSAMLACAASTRPSAPIKSYTIGFEERSYDESPYARAVAAHVGSEHHQQILDLASARDLIPSVLDRLDEPLGDASVIPTHLLSRFTRGHVTVALSGDGGDELFAGYDPFDALEPAALYARFVPAPLHRMFRIGAELLPRSTRNMSLDFKLRRTLLGLSYPEPLWAPVWMSPLDPKDAAELFEAPAPVETTYDEVLDLWETGPASTRIDRLMQFFVQFYLQDDILAKVDRASMMCSLETRAPFLDNDVAAFCQRLPAHFKYRKGTRKYLLKKALEQLLPHEILHRRKKGFGIPLAAWMRQVPVQPPLAPVDGIRLPFAVNAFEEHRTGRADHRLFLWTWWSLQRTIHRARERGA